MLIKNQESAGVLNLPNDEPEILENLVQFLYTGDFTIKTIEITHPSPPEETEASKEVETQAAVEVEEVEDDTIKENSEKVQIETTHAISEALVTVVKVYIIADKYDIPTLKKLSTTKYKDLLPSEWKGEVFCQSLKLLFDETMENDRMLKDVVIEFAGGKAQELMARDDFVSLIKENGDIGAEIFKASLNSLSKTPAISAPMAQLPNPACVSCGSSAKVEPARNTTANVIWRCKTCRIRLA